MAFLLVRLPLQPVLGGQAPYALIFLAVVIACVLAGWRSGLVALLTGQILTLYWVVEPPGEFAANPQRLGAFFFAGVAQLMILIVITQYQREVDLADTQKDQRMDVLSDALREIDHRVRNNHQTVLALVRLQSQRSTDPAVKEALNQVADRITAVARVTERLAQRGEDLESVRLGEHLRELCDEVGHGLSREGIDLQCELAEVSASAEKATAISIILNELLTNALKHAFGDEREGVIRVDTRTSSAGFELIVADDGMGMKNPRGRGTGLGRKLVDTFVRQIGASHDVATSEAGTTHRVVVPSLD